ncbi:DUF6465 family protein [Lacrimispora indolis]|uniref:DUF6465 family protein n=1 Tax=Lacrimispora indolis TaxID=69825 RepID=UPI00045E8CF7|nr:DUF6465 family protein [Lacrimispora indolis]MBE7720353.1 hypothetical protein [Lacrimispora celerecrescens]
MENNKSAGKRPVKAAEEKAVGKATAKKAAAAAQVSKVKVQEEKESAAVKKAPVKKSAAPRKTTAKKTEPEVTLFIEYSGKQIAAGEVVEAVKKDYLSKQEGAAVKTIEVYVKPEENTAYYAVNGEGSDQYKIML